MISDKNLIFKNLKRAAFPITRIYPETAYQPGMAYLTNYHKIIGTPDFNDSYFQKLCGQICHITQIFFAE